MPDDFHELQTVYPFSSLTFAPTAKISEAVVTVVAANRKLIDDMSAERSDFTGKYDRTLRIVIPFDYREKGCKVYGGAWIELEKVQKSDRHFHDHTVNGYQFCVGVPSSFAQLKNVLLENVRTAENMLIAYCYLIQSNPELMQKWLMSKPMRHIVDVLVEKVRLSGETIPYNNLRTMILRYYSMQFFIHL